MPPTSNTIINPHLPGSLAHLSSLTRDTVFDALQRDFSPTLDPSLLAALLADIEFPLPSKQPPPKNPKSKSESKSATSKNAPTPLETSLNGLYEMLQSLAAHAEVEVELGEEGIEPAAETVESSAPVEEEDNVKELDQRPSKGKRTPAQSTIPTLPSTLPSTKSTSKSTTKSSKSHTSSSKSTSTDNSSISGDSSGNSDSTNVNPQALAFLRTALPQLSTRKLVRALEAWEASHPSSSLEAGEGDAEDNEAASGDDERDELNNNEGAGIEAKDIWTLISALISSEEAREMDERGFSTTYIHEIEDEDDFNNLNLNTDPFDYTDYTDKAYAAQLQADEALARALDAEERADPLLRVLNKKGDDEDDAWVVKGKKGGKAAKKKDISKEQRGGRDIVKVKLNDVRQGGAHHTSALNRPATTPYPKKSFAPTTTTRATATNKDINADLDLDMVAQDTSLEPFLTSLASHLTSLLPPSRPPSTMFLQTSTTSSSTTAPPQLSSDFKKFQTSSDSKKNQADICTYIQNVYLSPRVLHTKFGGRVYTAVRACLSSVVAVGHEVLQAEKARIQSAVLAKVKAEEDAMVQAERDAVRRLGFENSDSKNNYGSGGRDGTRRREGGMVWDDVPVLGRGKRERVRTATERDAGRGWEPGEGRGRGRGAPGAGARGRGRGGGRGRGKREVRDGTRKGKWAVLSVQDGKEDGEDGSGDVDGREEGRDEEREESEDGEEDEERKTLLFTLLDILLPQYALVETEGGAYVDVHQLTSDIELCIAVLEGSGLPSAPTIKLKDTTKDDNTLEWAKEKGETALELATLLCELYVGDAEPGRERGVFMEMLGSGGAEYGRARRQVVSYAQSVGARGAGRVQGAEERPSGPGYHAGGASVLTTPRGLGESSMQGVVVREDLKHKPSPYQWQAVKARKAPANRVYSVLPHLPTYTRDVNGIKRREEGDIGVVTLVSSSIAGGSSNAASEYAQAEKEHQRRIQDNYRRRDDLLREAARMYNRRGGRKARGASGDIAWYFAERAHEFTEAARREQLNAARAMVLRKQAVSGEQDAIDLHGTTVAEAEAIVLEVLEKRRGAGQLRIVTGRGSHSVGGQSVLKPAVRKRLVAEGYTVRGWEAGLVVVMS